MRRILPVSFHTRSNSKHGICVPARRRHTNTLRVFKTVSRCFLTVFFRREHEEASLCADPPPSSLPRPLPASPCRYVTSVTLPDVREEGGVGVGRAQGGPSTHCWALGHGNPTACKTPCSCSVCACVWV